MILRKATPADISEILTLHQRAATTPNGVARLPQEITAEYVNDFVKNSLTKGFILVGELNKKIIAEIHCYHFDPICFKHTINNLTLVVDPDFHGQGLGRKIIFHLLDEIKNNHQNILRVELMVRKDNVRAVKLYESLGFNLEGIMKSRILDNEGKLSDDTIMAWFNPNFKG